MSYLKPITFFTCTLLTAIFMFGCNSCKCKKMVEVKLDTINAKARAKLSYSVVDMSEWKNMLQEEGIKLNTFFHEEGQPWMTIEDTLTNASMEFTKMPVRFMELEDGELSLITGRMAAGGRVSPVEYVLLPKFTRYMKIRLDGMEVLRDVRLCGAMNMVIMEGNYLYASTNDAYYRLALE